MCGDGPHAWHGVADVEGAGRLVEQEDGDPLCQGHRQPAALAGEQVFGTVEGLVNYTRLDDPEETMVTAQRLDGGVVALRA
ncbi:hypothetical protein WQ59_18170 [Streptomyces sp. KE1]|nr:hypothetical protein WQ59_18170 [Streptomyces sp. KE1]